MTNELNRGTPAPVRLSIPSNRAAQGGATTRLTVAGNRKFESISLQQRVFCELGSRTKFGPGIAALRIPENQANISFVLRNCNWLQGLEGDIDPSHLNFLHYGSQTMEDFEPTSVARFGAIYRDPEYKVAETELGTMYGAYRPAETGALYWRIAHFMFPCWTLAPYIPFEHYRIVRGWVPLDDTHMMLVVVGPKTGPGVQTMRSRRVADAGLPPAARDQPWGQGSRPQGAGQVPRVRSEGLRSRSAPGRVNLALVPTGTTRGRLGELWQHGGSQRSGPPDRRP
jgi:hypothetical protein